MLGNLSIFEGSKFAIHAAADNVKPAAAPDEINPASAPVISLIILLAADCRYSISINDFAAECIASITSGCINVPPSRVFIPAAFIIFLTFNSSYIFFMLYHILFIN